MEKFYKWMSLFIFLCCLMILICGKVLQPVWVIGESMSPAITEDSIIQTRRVRENTTILRGDIVVANMQDMGKQDVVKRVVGMPGDVIEVFETELRINDKPFCYYDSALEIAPKQFQLSSDEYFLVGDNVNHSSDSRMFGPVNKSTIKAIEVKVLIKGKE